MTSVITYLATIGNGFKSFAVANYLRTLLDQVIPALYREDNKLQHARSPSHSSFGNFV